MKDFKDFLTEGVYDKHIFKAFFLAGGPGSGKSWVAKRTLGGTGMKVINSDAGFKRYAKKAKLDLERMDKFNDDETRLKNKLREKSKRGTLTQLEYAIDERLGLILDSTARDIDRIESEKYDMDQLGYETYMVFVNTTLETALKRNQYVERGRPVPEHIVIKSHKEVQANRRKLMNIFGRNYVEVNNDKDLDVINSNVYKKIVSLQRIPFSKARAKRWYQDELALKKLAGERGGSVGGLFGRMFGKRK
jgi:cytidylate kinase